MTTEAVTTKDQFNAVVEFMTVAGQEVNTEFKMPSLKVGNFRLSLIDEELNGINELIYSLTNDNPVGVLDGICDVLYVVYGAIATFGLEAPKWNVPSINHKEKHIPEMHVALAHISHITGGFERTKRGLYLGDQITIQSGLRDIIDTIIDLSITCGLNVADAFKEVHASNMAKFCSNADECARSIYQRQTEGKTDYDGAEGFEVRVGDTSYFVIRRAGDGKVLKGLNFFEPDLAKFINA